MVSDLMSSFQFCTIESKAADLAKDLLPEESVTWSASYYEFMALRFLRTAVSIGSQGVAGTTKELA